ncbi:hypothetical protein [Duganella callida]|uniref:Uncharacterized protein n=1 Tax=Duganella callida TaxID=2561932 RepID=A0A4Y9RXQ7_9BURK|nr:hypothetical protein [Duganella callida]TFW13844.1 hypothetical protein E4L98_28290 [Duganella callida]
MTTAVSITPFINVLVWVKRKVNEPGYDVRCEPEAPKVVQQDTVINYQIVDTYGQDIVFSGLDVSPPDVNQISPPSISYSGKLLTVNDANTYDGWLSLYLEFTDRTEGVRFKHDPQVRNEPEI